MDKQFEKTYHDLEEKDWWFKSRREAVCKFISKNDKNISILDVGCAGGLLLQDLTKAGFADLSGIDVSAEAIEKCRQKGYQQTYLMDGSNINLPGKSFDIVVSSDSLEHIQNEKEALVNWFSLLKPGGKLVLFVPAFMFLWSHHDNLNHHFRRYTKKELIGKLKAAGFEIERAGYWNFMLFLPIACIRFLKNKFYSGSSPSPDMNKTKPVLNVMLRIFLILENSVIKWVVYPFGVSVFCIGRKPE